MRRLLDARSADRKPLLKERFPALLWTPAVLSLLKQTLAPHACLYTTLVKVGLDRMFKERMVGNSTVDPRVALIITTHNRPDYVEEALLSAKSQTYKNLEILVVDDGSSDSNMLLLLDRFSDSGVRVLRNAHEGVSGNIHKGVNATTSKYVMILNDDDLIDPPYIEEAVRAAEADCNIGMVYCQATKFGTEVGPWILPAFNIPDALVHNMIFATMLFRRADWEAVGGHDRTMIFGREDHDFVLKLAGLGRTAHRLEGTYFHYRQHQLASVNRISGEDRRKRAIAHASIFRNNIDLYRDHAEEFWFRYFTEVQEAQRIRLRYSRLENLRERFPRLVKAARTLLNNLKL